MGRLRGAYEYLWAMLLHMWIKHPLATIDTLLTKRGSLVAHGDVFNSFYDPQGYPLVPWLWAPLGDKGSPGRERSVPTTSRPPPSPLG